MDSAKLGSELTRRFHERAPETAVNLLWTWAQENDISTEHLDMLAQPVWRQLVLMLFTAGGTLALNCATEMMEEGGL